MRLLAHSGFAGVARAVLPRGIAALVGLGLITLTAQASSAPFLADRAAVVFTAAELGGVAYPRFIWQRELAFLARIEALSDKSFEPTAQEPYRDRHVHVAMERAIAEMLLESFDIDPAPTPAELKSRALAARLIVTERVGSPAAITDAAAQEGMADVELWRTFQRQARASLYLDRMVAPMLEPSKAELRALHQGTATPFSHLPFEEVQDRLRRWYVGQRLAGVLSAFYETARGRIRIEIVGNSAVEAPSPAKTPQLVPPTRN